MKATARLFFRKLRETGNYSIEASFLRMIECFPQDSDISLESFTSSYFSNGLIPRIKSIVEARSRCADINHITGDIHYLAFGMPGRNTLLTIHDCGLVNHPNPLAGKLLKWIWLDLPVRHCRYITAVSNATRDDIVRLTGCNPDKIIVIPTVISNTFQQSDRKFNSKRPRILHIGLAPNKNLARHIAAIRDIDCELHIIGKLDKTNTELLETGNVRYTSAYNISQEDMQSAYADCDLLLFASTLEGFGMPIIEAQTVGRPVVTSNISSMPEVAGRGACLVDPYDIASIRNGIRKVIDDNSYRESIIEYGFANRQRFSPHTIARSYEDLYKKILDQ